MSVPKFLLPALERVSRYMQDFYPDREFPVEFWKIEENELTAGCSSRIDREASR